MNSNIKILLVDDHGLLREALKVFIEREQGFTVIGEASTGKEAIEYTRNLRPDIVILDLALPDSDGLEVIPRLKAIHDSIKILVLTSFDEEEKIFEALSAGASGYIIKTAFSARLIKAIHEVSKDLLALPPTVAQKLLRRFTASKSPQKNKGVLLSSRELEILGQLVQGKKNKEIARDLFISERTVRNHVSKILSKLQLANRTQAALFAVREGLISPKRLHHTS